MRTISDQGLNVIKRFEGLRLNAYQCSAGVWTIGYGTTLIAGCKKVNRGDTCTLQEAEVYLRQYVKQFEQAINQRVNVPLTQSQFDALVSFVYNIGIGNFTASTLLRKLNQRDYSGAAQEFLRWNRAKGRIITGLTNRRKEEKRLFES